MPSALADAAHPGPRGRRRPPSGRGRRELLAQALRQPGRALRGVVESDEPAEALGDQPLADVHLEAHLAGRAAYLADPAAHRDLLVEGDGRAVVDVALGEDHPELLAAGLSGVVVGPQAAHECDPRGFEVAQVHHVVEVAVGVEVAEADPLAMDVDHGHAGADCTVPATRLVGDPGAASGSSAAACPNPRVRPVIATL